MNRVAIPLILLLLIASLVTSCGNKSEFASYLESEVESPMDDPGTVDPDVELELQRDEFVQSGEMPKVDILWVIDNSGSMRDEQEAIAANFETFISGFVSNSVDFKMAIITTDVSARGAPVNPLNALTLAAATSNRAQFISNFQTYINVGISGSWDERGLETTELFLDNYGSSFLRDGAYLNIIVVSDENDHSALSLYQGFENSIASYLPGRESFIKMFSIVEIDNIDPLFVGARYIEKSSYFGGISVDIDDNFSTTLSSVGETIVNLVDSFALTKTPYNDVVNVSVNGITATKNVDFIYNSSTKSIQFKAGHIPSAGDLITIEYDYEI